MALVFPLNEVRKAFDRFPREQDPREMAARARLAELGQAEADEIWSGLATHLLLNPVYLRALWPDICAQHPKVPAIAKSLIEQRWIPAQLALNQQTSADWVAEQGDPARQGSLMHRLLVFLLHFSPSEDPTFAALKRYYMWRDVLSTLLVEPAQLPVLDRIFGLLDMQLQQWPKAYVAGYAYQGYERLGIAGAKPSQERLANYGFLPWLQPQMTVLDVGCNNGFMAIEIARHVASVTAIEYNPFLVEIARVAAEALGQRNVAFEVADFSSYVPPQRFDVVISFANHCTIDGNLSVELEAFVAKLWAVCAEDGWLLFESHNVFGPGSGAPGDDGDLDRKFDIIERYFELVDSRMTRRYVPERDLDKLFVVLRRRPQILPTVARRMQLAEARSRYHYQGQPFAV